MAGIWSVLFQNGPEQYFRVNPGWKHIDVRDGQRVFCLLWGEPGLRRLGCVAFSFHFIIFAGPGAPTSPPKRGCEDVPL